MQAPSFRKSELRQLGRGICDSYLRLVQSTRWLPRYSRHVGELSQCFQCAILLPLDHPNVELLHSHALVTETILLEPKALQKVTRQHWENRCRSAQPLRLPQEIDRPILGQLECWLD